MDDKVKTWVDGKLVDLTDDRASEMASELGAQWIPPAPVRLQPRRRGFKKWLIDTCLAADHPLYAYADAFLGWAWITLVLVLSAGLVWRCNVR